ncbi:hypothetical protein RMCBS344292_09052 [Rhizopus microsporus]|nr:hypothetical protein RMCBS344292_09052 [Rhizopus microsporus]
MQQEDTTLREQLESTLANTADPNRPRRTRHDELSQGPFLDNLYPDRSVQHPLGEGTKNKRQLSWGLFRKFMEDVHGSSIDNVRFNAARDHITIFRLPDLIRKTNIRLKMVKSRKLKSVSILNIFSLFILPLAVNNVSEHIPEDVSEHTLGDTPEDTSGASTIFLNTKSTSSV